MRAGILADIVLITHVAFVAFVVVGLILIICGVFCGWRWIRNPWFRIAHLVAIGLVILQAWSDAACPLTTLEMNLCARAGEPTYEGSCIAHWLQQLLYYEAPAWVFTTAYTLFGLIVALSWFAFRPRSYFSHKVCEK